MIIMIRNWYYIKICIGFWSCKKGGFVYNGYIMWVGVVLKYVKLEYKIFRE